MNKKKGIVTVNSEFKDFLEKKNNGGLKSKSVLASNGYAGSQRLLVNLASSGFDVAVVHPEDVYVDEKNNLSFKKLFVYDSFSTKLISVDTTKYEDLDFLWVRQIGENILNKQFSKIFCEMIDNSQISASYVLNPQGSTKFFLKDVQKKELSGIPFPEQYRINSLDELLELAKTELIIAKPISGWKSQGIKNILSQYDAEKFIQEKPDLKNYFFEEYLPLSNEGIHELRINFVGNNMWARAKIYDVDERGYDYLKDFIFPKNISDYHQKIVKSVQEQSGMHMGSVDFRPRKISGKQDAVLEINNAGIGLSFQSANTFYSFFNLEPYVVDFIRQKVSK